jgi:hypothetical protein
MEKSTRVPTTHEIIMIRVEARIGMLTSWSGSTTIVSRMRSVTAGLRSRKMVMANPMLR